jgi:hypothetical protein
MPIQHAIWKVGDKPTPLSTSRLTSEQKLEEMIGVEIRGRESFLLLRPLFFHFIP